MVYLFRSSLNQGTTELSKNISTGFYDFLFSQCTDFSTGKHKISLEITWKPLKPKVQNSDLRSALVPGKLVCYGIPWFAMWFPNTVNYEWVVPHLT